VGKSRLVQEAVRVARDSAVRVLVGRCVELGGEGLPLAPLMDMLRAVARSTPPEDLDKCLGAARLPLARLLPELDPAAGAGDLQDGSPTQLLLIVVEDLHWADQSTLDLVAFLVQTLRELGVLLLVTYRSDEMHRRHPLRPLVTAWERMRTVERLELRRFTRAEVGEQLRAICETTPSADFMDVVFERSQGNAFLVEEILAATDSGADPRELPPSLRDVLLARTETVSEASQRVLRTAAAAGPRVGERLLEVVAGVAEAQLYPALRESVEHHLLVVDEAGRGYAFQHALTRDALYDDMLPGERVRLHAAYGTALAADPTLLAPGCTGPRCTSWPRRRHSSPAIPAEVCPSSTRCSPRRIPASTRPGGPNWWSAGRSCCALRPGPGGRSAARGGAGIAAARDGPAYPGRIAGVAGQLSHAVR
jgi:hypothetical protein